MDRMVRFIIFVLLLQTGRLVRGVTVAENVRFVEVGRPVKFWIDEQNIIQRKNCVVKTNQGEVLNYESVKDRDDIMFFEKCSLAISKVNNTHAGTWQIRGHVANDEDNITMNNNKDNVASKEQIFTFHLYVTKAKDALPSQYIEAYDGHYVSMKHNENYENLTACNLTGIAINSGPINLLTEKRNDFQLYDQCGVRMKVNASYDGSWTLHAIVNDYVVYEISFAIDVHQLKTDDDMMVIQWTRGSPGTISLPDVTKMCQIVDPNGVIVATSLRKCYYVVKVATVQHEGVWLARYNMYGMLEPIERKFRIETVDQVIFNASVSHDRDDGTTLLCRLELKNARAPESCSFVRPDGKNLYITPAVSNERYFTYINFDTKRGHTYNILECGIKIWKVETIDYGAWRCNLRIPYNPRIFGTVLYVDHPDSRKNGNNVNSTTVKIRADEVHVKRGDPFTIKCVADAALDYCWLRSPNGTSYSTTHDKEVEAPFVLPYHGNGLSLGECGATISAAVKSDNGRWHCSMGLVNGGEKITPVPVRVTETYLVAERTEIAISARNDPVLSCHILPRMLDRTVHYCRWIRPDGYGIYNDISHRYTTNSSYSQCRLVILNYRPEEDDGNWKCVAGLAGENGRVEEAWDHVRVEKISTAHAAVDKIGTTKWYGILIIVFLLILFVVSVILCIGRYRYHTDSLIYRWTHPKSVLDKISTKTNQYEKDRSVNHKSITGPACKCQLYA